MYVQILGGTKFAFFGFCLDLFLDFKASNSKGAILIRSLYKLYINRTFVSGVHETLFINQHFMKHCFE